jgi:hypothetical protein
MLARLESGKTWFRDRVWKGIKTVLARRRYRVLALLLGLAFFLLYLFSIQHIVYLPNVDFSYQASIPSVRLVSNWTARVFKTRVPFIWEPIAAVYLTRHLMIQLALPNILLGGLLGSLLGVNLSMGFFELFREGGLRSVDSVRSLAAAIPSLLTGFACCAPTILIAIGGSLAAGLSAGLVAARPYFLPASLAILVLNAGWTAGNISYEGVCRGGVIDVEIDG